MNESRVAAVVREIHRTTTNLALFVGALLFTFSAVALYALLSPVATGGAAPSPALLVVVVAMLLFACHSLWYAGKRLV